ncbi:hypothetical protein AAZX31_13G023700, partial [Glycine max]
LGTNDHPNWLIHGFHDAISYCNLRDLPIEDSIEEQHDRVLATHEWIDLFPNFNLVNVVSSKSDHLTILLCLQDDVARRFEKQFKFENSWLLEPNFNEIVENNWTNSSFDGFRTKIKYVYENMNNWVKQPRMKFWYHIDCCKHNMEMQTKNSRNELHRKKPCWKQIAKVLWLKDGDINSKFFHSSVKTCKKINMISSLVNDDGSISLLDDVASQWVANVGITSSFYTIT